MDTSLALHNVPGKQTPDKSVRLLHDPPPVVSMVAVVVWLEQYVPRGQMVQADERLDEYFPVPQLEGSVAPSTQK